MVRILTNYKGEKRCELTHEPSGSKINTDAPKDNNGLGQTFSPTDLVAGATTSCMLTVLGISAEKDGIDITGSHATVDKEMGTNPRRIVKLAITMHLPKKLTEHERNKLEIMAKACPVKKSLHPEIEVPVEYIYDV